MIALKRNTRHLILSAGIIALLVYSCGGSKTGDGRTGQALDGEQLFTNNKCFSCHGADGTGQIKGPPDFTNAQWQAAQSDKRMTATIKNGNGIMPPFRSRLSDEEIRSLIAYVRGFAAR